MTDNTGKPAFPVRFSSVASGFAILLVVCWSITWPADHPSLAENDLLLKIQRLNRERNFSQARQECATALEQYPESLAFYYHCGLSSLFAPGEREVKKKDYAVAIARFEKALSAYQLSLKKREQLADLQFHLALAWQLSLNFDMASHWYREALKTNDRLSAAWYNLAVCQEAQKNIIEANRAWMQYQESLRRLDDDF